MHLYPGEQSASTAQTDSRDALLGATWGRPSSQAKPTTPNPIATGMATQTARVNSIANTVSIRSPVRPSVLIITLCSELQNRDEAPPCVKKRPFPTEVGDFLDMFLGGDNRPYS